MLRACHPLGRGRFFANLRLPGLSAPLPADLLVWPAPRTYTGQDLVEIHIVSSPPLVEAVVTALLAQGARPAQAGEFTMRAFLSGKLDLTQAEAVLGVIAAETADDLRAALRQLAGGIGQPLRQLRDELLALLAEIEAGLDFAEEDLAFIAADELGRRLQQVRRRIEELGEQLDRRNVSGRPFRVVLAGAPNAGKSSLFNALAGRPLALVSPEAGTTRDYLSARLTLDGAEIELIDTAGEELFPEHPAHESSNDEEIIHRQAQDARRQQIADADLVLLCVDASQAISRRRSGRSCAPRNWPPKIASPSCSPWNCAPPWTGSAKWQARFTLTICWIGSLASFALASELRLRCVAAGCT
jgi:tRNA modification GTPase